MTLCALILFCTFTLVAEKMPFVSGLGFDGIEYAKMARDFDKIVHGSLHLDLATSNRFLPSLLCRLTLEGLGVTMINSNIVAFFTWYNVVLFTASAWLWGNLAMVQKFSVHGRWLGFIALFFSHASLKYNIHYATLTDVTAMFLGLAMLWAYLRRSDAVLMVATLAGSVTWPTLLTQGLLLLVFPFRDMTSPPAPARSTLVTAAILTLAVLRFWARGERPLAESIIPEAGAILEILFIGLAYYHLLNFRSLYSFKRLAASLSLPRLLAATLAAVAIPAALFALTGFRIDLLQHGESYLYQAVRLGMKYPGEFLVAHTLYFGPWVLLLVLAFPEAAHRAHRAGVGLVLVCLLALVQSLTPLSRQLIAAMPFFVFLAVAALDKKPYLTGRFLRWFSVLTLVVSKAWMHFSTDQADPERTFSFAWYVSSTGAWMTFSLYWIQSIVVAIMLIGLWIVLRQANQNVATFQWFFRVFRG